MGFFVVDCVYLHLITLHTFKQTLGNLAMNPKQLIIKCYAKQEEGVWVAVCLDFNLAAQGDSFDEAKAKIESMIAEYVYDALAGNDTTYAPQLY
jgi:predicted RNase H-like HicB family nuclease